MRALLVASMALIWAAASHADLVVGGLFVPPPSACEQVGTTQTFDSDLTGWTAYDGDPVGDATPDDNCPVVQASGTVQRSRPGAVDTCSNSFGLARFDTDIGSPNGCLRARLADYDASAGVWQIGLLWWHQSGAAADDYVAAYCVDGQPCTNLRLVAPDETEVIVGAFGSVDVNDYVGVCFRIVDEFTRHIALWNFGASAPGNPTGWGDPTLQTTGCPAIGATDCLSAPGERVGVFFKAQGAVPQNADVAWDDVAVYHGCEEVGGTASGGNSWTAGNTWATGSNWE